MVGGPEFKINSGGGAFRPDWVWRGCPYGPIRPDLVRGYLAAVLAGHHAHGALDNLDVRALAARTLRWPSRAWACAAMLVARTCGRQPVFRRIEHGARGNRNAGDALAVGFHMWALAALVGADVVQFHEVVTEYGSADASRLRRRGQVDRPEAIGVELASVARKFTAEPQRRLFRAGGYMRFRHRRHALGPTERLV